MYKMTFVFVTAEIFWLATSRNWRCQVEVKTMLAHLIQLAQLFKFKLNKFFMYCTTNFAAHGTVLVCRNLDIDIIRITYIL